MKETIRDSTGTEQNSRWTCHEGFIAGEEKIIGKGREWFQKSVCLAVLGRVEKEKEDLKVDLRASRVEVSGLRREIEEAKREEKRLRQAIRQADMDIGRQKKDIDNVMNERDILGTQLVRRNDELSLQYSRIKVRSLSLSRVHQFEIYVIQRVKLKFNVWLIGAVSEQLWNFMFAYNE